MEKRKTIKMQFLMIFLQVPKNIITIYFSVKYGKAMVDLCSEIERNISQFKVPPIGPLGKYMKFSRSSVSRVMSSNFLSDFIS